LALTRLVRRLKAALSLWERSVLAFAISPWSSGALLLYAFVWTAAEALRTKAMGWDGFITLALGEVALATLRKLKGKSDPDDPAVD